MEPTYAYNPAPFKDNRRTLKILIGVIVLIIALIVGVQWLIGYESMGTITISSSKNATITVSDLTNSATIYSGKTTLSKRIKTGKYSVAVSVNSYETTQVVSIQAHHTTHYSLVPPQALAVEPVSDTTASYISAGDSELYFINSTGNLSKIGADNSQSTLNPNITFQTATWANSSFGIGVDKTGVLYTITSGTTALLDTPFHASANNYPLFTVAPDHTIYVAYNKQVYRKEGAAFIKIYTSNNEVTALSASNNEVVVDINPDSKNAGGVHNSSSLVVIPVSGAPVSRAIGTFFAIPSPNGQSIATTDTHGGEILNNRLQLIAAVPTPNFSNPVWLNNSVLLYSVGSQLWEYDLSAQRAQLRATTPLEEGITELSLNDTGSYVYMGVSHINNQPIIERIGLNGQGVLPVLSSLQSIMPYTGQDYFMTLTNFTKPVIYVQPLPPLSNTNAQYQQEAVQQLQKVGIDISQLEIRVVLPQ